MSTINEYIVTDNTNNINATIIRTCDFNEALYQYMSLIDYMLEIFVKHNIKLKIKNIKIDSYKFSSQLLSNAHFTHVNNNYVFDFKEFVIVSTLQGQIVIPDIYPLNELCSKIKNKIKLVVKPNNSINILRHNNTNTNNTANTANTTNNTNTTNNNNKNSSREKFIADKNTYYKLKTKLLNKSISENNILEEFSNKYNILKLMDENKLLDTDDEYSIYLDLHNSINSIDYSEVKEWNSETDEKYLKKKYDEIEKEKKIEFISNKETYYRLKKDISDNKFKEDNIPTMFSGKYMVLKSMDENKLLDADDEYNIYTELYNDIKNDYSSNNNLQNNIDNSLPKEMINQLEKV